MIFCSRFLTQFVVAIFLVTVHLSSGQVRSVSTRTRTQTTTTRTQTIGPTTTRTIRLSGGEILTIDSQTLQRLQGQGVDINNLQNLSETDLEALGITISTSTVNLQTDSGTQTIRLRGGQILTIDTVTLQRLQDQGVDINNLQNLSEEELERLGITLATRTVTTGTRTVRILPGTTRTITLRDGQVITVDSVTLTTLQNQGVDIDNLQSLSEEDLERFGLIVTTRTVSVARPVTATRTQVSRVDTSRTEVAGRTDTGIQVIAAPRPTPAPLAPRGGGARPRPVPPPPSQPAEEEEANPAPEPYSFSYTAETDDGAISEREESQDASGTITGFYTIRDADGNARRVDYVADANGYRATITTNEIGTESKSPADVDLQSSAPTAEVLTRQYQDEQDRLALQNSNQPRQPQPPARRVASPSSGQSSFTQQRANQRAAANIEIIRPVSSQTMRAARTESETGPRFVLTASVNRDSEPSEPVARFVASSSSRSADLQRYGTKS